MNRPGIPADRPYESASGSVPRVPSDGMSPGRAALSVAWAGLPMLTLGLATPFCFAAATLWRRRAHLLLATIAYTALLALQLAVRSDMNDPAAPGHDSASTVFGACVFIQAVGGCFHAFLVRRRVFDPHGVDGTAGNEAAIETVRRRRILRHRARELARTDVALARELRIGRPDLPRHYDDGGLVDINRAPAGVLATLPGVTPALAARIERIRAEAGGFVSAEELSALAGLPPDLTSELAEYGLFLR
ncbi:ComEA family DNA-binding protein [Actinomadura sp. HBU206391]|uniref:ComEA family DNA-binding protein n=1 Tax=Actinomadura sp. HBU206391 TaxID=2731692 RepID=UPI00164FE534|nr:helix-hairpin-helix domain-containing protein [Actinomadura sp. HBU206391]MBC6463456.1 helix-hairpin-helix domain-containing protein [Actinomadura sp. HBU206391]